MWRANRRSIFVRQLPYTEVGKYKHCYYWFLGALNIGNFIPLMFVYCLLLVSWRTASDFGLRKLHPPC